MDFEGLALQQMHKEWPLCEPSRGVIVGCSGGLDSTALFHVFRTFSSLKKNFELALCHVNFGLRGDESDADEFFISELAAACGVPLFVKKVSEAERTARRGESLQEWARRYRFAEFARHAESGWTIALAHHQDDVAENVLLRLARGASPGHLGMRGLDPPYWRPLLHQNKADILAYMTAHDFQHRHDASNDKLDYSRNVIRHKVLPELEAMFPGAAGRIAACAEEAADVSAHCQAGLLTELSGLDPTATRDRLIQLPRGLGRAALAGLIGLRAPGFRQLSRAWLDAILERAAVGDPTRYGRDLPGGGRVLIEKGGLRIEPSHTVIMSDQLIYDTES